MWPYIIVFSLIFLIVGPIAIFSSIRYYRKHRPESSEPMNHTYWSDCYYYRIPHTKADVWQALSMRNIYDTLEYRFDPENAAITFFSDLEASLVGYNFRIAFPEHPQGHLMTVTRNHSRKGMPYENAVLNKFWKNKVGAEPLPIHQNEAR